MTILTIATMMIGQASQTNLVDNAGFEAANAANNGPEGFSLTGKAHWFTYGYKDETATATVGFNAMDSEGGVSKMITGLDAAKGKWFKFSFKGLAEDGFVLSGDQLQMKFEFFRDGGKAYVEMAQRLVYREILKDRKDFAANGKFNRGGAAVWRTYEFEEMLPFKEVDSVRISVSFKGGAAKKAEGSYFFIDDFALTQSKTSSRGLTDPLDAAKAPVTAPTLLAGLVAVGGRWFYRPIEGESLVTDSTGHLKGPLKVDYRNANRLFYKTDVLTAVFANDMTSLLRPGHLDVNGNAVKTAKFVPDNVVIEFDGGSEMIVHAKNIPNHPTANFPDRYGTQGYNPGYIQEQNLTYRLPIEPKPNPKARVMTANNANYGLPMGTVGIAINGVSFFNPFDGNMEDAANLMDRCCGHPNPQQNLYHYHKYPICVNTPYADKGDGHSPVVGFAFDGFPVYGPYEASGELARDSKANPLDGFNGHRDAARGWHYHVSPGKFPYIIGGYYGYVESRNLAGPFRRMFEAYQP